MKLAVLADIHANLPALQTVTGHIEAWNPDRVIVAGDVINRGPRSPECLAFILEKQATAGWQVLKGNHEDYIIAHTKPDAPQSGPLLDIYRHTIWTLQQLNGDVSAFENWPDTICFAGPDGQEVRVTHASMLGNRRGIFPAMDEAELTRRVGEPLPALFCGAHTHLPLTRNLNGAVVVNAGAAGLPFDGDPRASYARLTWQGGAWQTEIVRLEYNREQMIADYQNSGFLQGGGPMTWLVLAELLHARSQLFAWMRNYFDPTLAGEMTVKKSVCEQLEKQGLWGEVKGYLG